MRHRLAPLLRPAPQPPVMAKRTAAGQTASVAPLAGGKALDSRTRDAMEVHFGHDLSAVRVHADPVAARTARGMGAAAFTRGHDIAFAPARYAPDTADGRALLAHEIAHVVQQTGSATSKGSSSAVAFEAEADAAASAVARGEQAPALTAAPPGVQLRIEMRDVGRCEQSGFGRLDEFVARLNAISTALIFDVAAGALTYAADPAGKETEFDRKMKQFIDAAAILPMRLTNRKGLLGNAAAGYKDGVDGDAWQSGYVDIDDLLAGDDLGFQTLLVHFLAERLSTPQYSKLIGTGFLNIHNFNKHHDKGIDAERDILRDFFGDMTIKLINDSPSPTIRRLFSNSRKDHIRRRITPGKGVDTGTNASSIEVWVRKTNKVVSADEYREILKKERDAAPVLAPPLAVPPVPVGP